MCSLSRHFIFIGILLFIFVLSVAQSAPSSNLRDEATPEQLRYLLIQRLLANQQRQQSSPLRKRTCYINAGLSHGCDYKDLVGAMAETNYWDSLHSPGRKRRGPQQYFPNDSQGDYSAPISYEFSSEA